MNKKSVLRKKIHPIMEKKNDGHRTPKMLALVLGIALVVGAAAARCVQLYMNVDLKTGAYIVTSPIAYFTEIMIFAVSVLILAILRIGYDQTYISNGVLYIDYWGMGSEQLSHELAGSHSLFFIVISVIEFVSGINGISDPIPGKRQKGEAILSVAPESIHQLIAVITVVFSLVLFFGGMYMQNYGRVPYLFSGLMFLYSIRALLYIIDMVHIDTVNVTKISERAFLILGEVCASVFFISLGRLLLGCNSRYMKTRLMMSGMLATAFIAVTYIPSVVFSFLPTEYELTTKLDLLSYNNLAVLLFCGFVTFELFTVRRKMNICANKNINKKYRTRKTNET